MAIVKGVGDRDEIMDGNEDDEVQKRWRRSQNRELQCGSKRKFKIGTRPPSEGRDGRRSGPGSRRSRDLSGLAEKRQSALREDLQLLLELVDDVGVDEWRR
jgi:hypothetical protein